MSETTQLTIANVPIVIPWNTQYKELLFFQAVPKDDNTLVDIDEDARIAKLKRRFEFTLNPILEALGQLPVGATIVDIGSGNSLIDVIINARFPDKKFKFILVDEDNTYPPQNPSNEFYRNNYTTYNDWFFIKKLIEVNNMDTNSFATKTPEEQWSDQPVDLVISTASWGWHYPVDTYLEKTHGLLKKDGYLYINEVLNIDNSLEKLSTMFNPIKVTMNKFIPTQSITENNRSLSFVVRNQIPVDKFGFVFLGQK